MFATDTFKKVKIVATIGPASSSPKMIAAMAKAGANVFRLNLSHLNHEQIRVYVAAIREAEKQAKHPLTIMGDLAGPKIRIGEIDGEYVLRSGERLMITRAVQRGNARTFSLNHPTALQSLKVGAQIFLGDGLVTL